MTKIDIDRLSEAELVDLHHKIVERLRFLEQLRAHARMLDRLGVGSASAVPTGARRPT